ncbi:MAG: hypothetical protein CMO47_14540 [Verrucomicrobiales bacterium]|nr:hypothetical protein [Verrucomicrobiales bacterium]
MNTDKLRVDFAFAFGYLPDGYLHFVPVPLRSDCVYLCSSVVKISRAEGGSMGCPAWMKHGLRRIFMDFQKRARGA